MWGDLADAVVIQIGDVEIAEDIDRNSAGLVEVCDGGVAIAKGGRTDDGVDDIAACALTLEASLRACTCGSTSTAVVVIAKRVDTGATADRFASGAYTASVIAGLGGEAGCTTSTAVVFVEGGIDANPVTKGASLWADALTRLAELSARADISASATIRRVGLCIDAHAGASR